MSWSLEVPKSTVEGERQPNISFHLPRVFCYSVSIYFWSVSHSAHLALGMKCICCTIGICYGFTMEMSGLNLGSGSFRQVDEISKKGSVCAE